MGLLFFFFTETYTQFAAALFAARDAQLQSAYISPICGPRESTFCNWSVWLRRQTHSCFHAEISGIDCRFFHSIISLTTGPSLLPKPVLHTVRSSASCFNVQYPLVSLISPGSCLPLLPRLPVTSFYLSFSNVF